MHLLAHGMSTRTPIPHSTAGAHTGPVIAFRDVDVFDAPKTLTIRGVDRDIEHDILTRRLDGLAALSSKDKAALAEVVVQARAVAGKTDIVSVGARLNGLHVIIAGFACRFTMRLDGSRQITSFFLPGDVCDLSDVTMMTDALGTLSDCRIATMKGDAARVLKATHPKIATAIKQSAHIEQGVSREWLSNLGRRASEKRTAHLFCELLARLQDVGLVEHDTFKMPLTQFDLGDALGLSYVQVKRTLQILRQRGLISLKAKVLSIINPTGLSALADFDPKYLRFEPGS